VSGTPIELKGRVALVTGATRGIGRACALALAGAGADVSAIATSEERLAALAKELQAKGVRVHVKRADVSKPEDADAAVNETLQALGRLDILVNNAGIARDNLLLRMKPEEWDEVMAVNLRGPFNFIKAATRPMMKQRSGRIVNISSVAGLIGNAGQANYTAAKAGLIALTKTAAKEYGSRGILVNAVAPGFIETDMVAGLDPEKMKEVAARLPMGRLGRPEEVAAVVLFLASDLAGYITGQTLVVDGGMSMIF
jgi:3-oxoacyl-[acyl-carrier protein] reductase